MFVICCVLSGVCLLFVVRRLVCVACSLLFVVCRVLSGVRCSLFAVCCLLFDG